MDKQNKNVVVIGGGSGTSAVLEGLKEYGVNLSAIITTSDDGSSSGKLRDEFGMIPPGDIRQCIIALAEKDFGYLNERFQGGSLAGHTLGNLLITLFSEKHKNFQQAVDEVLRLTGAAGSIIPVTLQPTTLVAELKDGDIVEGESNIIQIEDLNKRLGNLSIIPREHGNPKAKRAIREADCIVIGPGNIFASLTPPLLVEGIREAILESKAKKIYIFNLMNQKKLTRGFSAEDYLRYFDKVLGEDIFDNIIYNTQKIRPQWFKKYNIEDEPIRISASPDKRFIGANLVDTKIKNPDPSDPMARTLIRHNSKKLADTLWQVINA